MFLDLMYWTYAHIHTNTVFIVANTYIVHFLRSLATSQELILEHLTPRIVL